LRAAISVCIAIQKEPIAGVLHDAAAMVEDDGVDRTAMSLEDGVGAGLIGAHHARIPRDIGADDGGQTSLHILGAPTDRGPARVWQPPRILHFQNWVFIEHMEASGSVIRNANSRQTLGKKLAVDGGGGTD
jgi:hypothetical protein